MSPPIADGEVLAGKYRVERVLGEGAHGIVVLARHIELEETVAIKFLRKKSAQEPAIVERFLREARAAVRLKNEHVVRVFDVGKLESGIPYIVMEYLDGRDLDQLIQERGKLPLEEAVGYVLQACEAVAEAHAMGMVHRDLKLSNLFLAQRSDDTSLVKVLDFGIAKWRSEDPAAKRLTTDKMGLGSPLYMAPEQIADAGAADARSDVWSLGVILYELVTGQPPFDAPGVEGVLAAVMTRDAPRLTEVLPNAPAGLEALVLACLRKDPALRTATVAEFARGLEPFASDEDKPRIARIARSGGGRHRPAAITEIGPGPSSGANRAFALAATAADATRATHHATAVSKDADADDAVALGLPSRPSTGRLVAIGVAVAAVAVLGAVFVLRGPASPPPAPASPPASPVSPPNRVPDPPAPIEPAPQPAASTANVTPPATSATAAHPSATPARTTRATHAPPSQKTTADAVTPAPSPKPTAKGDDVRSLIDGRR